MKRVKRRAAAALILAALVLLGMTAYAIDFADNGEKWVTYKANEHVYTDGALTLGALTDRNGTVLAHAQDGTFTYADDAAVRVSSLHAVGDFAGNIGTGAITAFAGRMAGYSPITGIAGRGEPLALSIDAGLNRTAYTALAGRRGAVLVMDYTTGEILCMVSSPAYDPNVGFDEADPAYEGVYLNRALSAVYPPGSVFKLVTLAAALENIGDLSERTFTCAGSVDIGGVAVNCTGVHGQQTIEQALANSCNCAFAELSLELGGKTLEKYAKRFGFCEQLDVSGIDTAAGSFDVAASGSADLAWSGIGQYTDQVCPLAMLRYAAAIAGGGTVAEPVLLAGTSGGNTKLLSEETADSIGQMMSYSLSYSYGTWNFPGLALCAKTGTAEVGDGTSHAWFAGYLDDAAHPYAFCVVIEHGGSGLSAAGSVANTVLQAAVNQ